MGSQKTDRLSFFVTISDEDFTQKLIPTGLIKYFNGVVPVESILRTSSSGRCWLVKLKREEENLFFQEGWSDFVRDNSLESGNFLVLEYLGNSQFYVKIYERNGFEKKLRSTGDDIEKPINPEISRKEELKSKGELTKNHTEFDDTCHAEVKFRRDSVGFDKNKKTYGSCQPTSTTGVHVAGCSVEAERPYFILTWTQKKDSQMEVPGMFLREVGGRLPVGVYLKCQDCIVQNRGSPIPTCMKWPIELRKADGRVWFEDGWKQFIDYHCLSDDHLLIFRYDGNTQFDVSIFNITSKSAYGMKDLDDFRHHDVPNLDKRHELNEESRNESACQTKSRCKNKRSSGSMNLSEERPPSSGYKKKRSSGLNEEDKIISACQTKSRCTSSSKEPDSGYKKKRSSGHNEENRSKPACQTKSRCMSSSEKPDSGCKKKRSCGLNEENRNKSACGTQSRCKNKSTGARSLTSSEKSSDFRYERKRSSGDQGKTIEGSGPDESSKTRKQSEESSPYEGNEKCHQSRIQHEDKEESLESVRQEEMEEEDHESRIQHEDKEESLESVRHEEMEEEDYVECFDVDSSTSIKVPAVAKKWAVIMKNKKKKASASQLASEFKSKNPFFTINLRSSYLKGHFLPIPSKFGRTHLPEDLHGHMIRVEVSDGRTWLLKCIDAGSNRSDIRLSKGVTEFLSSNNFELGDICVFEAIKMNPEIVFKVHMFHHGDMD